MSGGTHEWVAWTPGYGSIGDTPRLAYGIWWYSLRMVTLLEEVIEQYLSSGDYNGLFFHNASVGRRAQAAKLTRVGLLQVVSEEGYPNPSIRPWPSMRTVERQVESVRGSATDQGAVCLYPEGTASAGARASSKHHG
jgi:hypothetical protein